MKIPTAKIFCALAAACIFLFYRSAFAQPSGNDVILTIIIAQPTNVLSEWRSNPNRAQVTLTNITDKALTLRLSGYAENASINVKFQTKDDYPVPQIALAPHATRILYGGDLAIFGTNSVSFSGTDAGTIARTGILPPGNYTICLQAVDYNAPHAQRSTNGCANFLLQDIDPPRLIQPACDQTIDQTSPQLITFQWLAPTPALQQGVNYDFTLVEVTGTQNANDAMQQRASAPLFSRTLMNQTNLIYSPSEPMLTIGHTYAWRVQAKDPVNNAAIKNNGMSEVCEFVWGVAENLLTDRLVKVTPPSNGDATQQKLTDPCFLHPQFELIAPDDGTSALECFSNFSWKWNDCGTTYQTPEDGWLPATTGNTYMHYSRYPSNTKFHLILKVVKIANSESPKFAINEPPYYQKELNFANTTMGEHGTGMIGFDRGVCHSSFLTTTGDCWGTSWSFSFDFTKGSEPVHFNGDNFAWQIFIKPDGFDTIKSPVWTFSPIDEWKIVTDHLTKMFKDIQSVDLGDASGGVSQSGKIINFQMFKNHLVNDSSSLEMHDDGTIYAAIKPNAVPEWYNPLYAYDQGNPAMPGDGSAYTPIDIHDPGYSKFNQTRNNNFNQSLWNNYSFENYPPNQLPSSRWYKIELPPKVHRTGNLTCDWANFLQNGDGDENDMFNLIKHHTELDILNYSDYGKSQYGITIINPWFAAGCVWCDRTIDIMSDCNSLHDGTDQEWEHLAAATIGGCSEWQTILPKGTGYDKLYKTPDALMDQAQLDIHLGVQPTKLANDLKWNGHPNNDDRDNTIPWITSYAEGIVVNSWLSGGDASIDHNDNYGHYWRGSLPSYHTSEGCGAHLVGKTDGSLCSDWCFFTKTDPEYNFMRSNNTVDPNANEANYLVSEIETWSIPTDYRPAPGDRILVGGRWIADVGHKIFNTEIHPVEMFVSSHEGSDKKIDTSKVVITGAWNGGTMTFDIWPRPRPNAEAVFHFSKHVDAQEGLSLISETVVPSDDPNHTNPNHIHVTVTAPFIQNSTGSMGGVNYNEHQNLQLAAKYETWWETPAATLMKTSAQSGFSLGSTLTGLAVKAASTIGSALLPKKSDAAAAQIKTTDLSTGSNAGVLTEKSKLALMNDISYYSMNPNPAKSTDEVTFYAKFTNNSGKIIADRHIRATITGSDNKTYPLIPTNPPNTTPPYVIFSNIADKAKLNAFFWSRRLPPGNYTLTTEAGIIVNGNFQIMETSDHDVVINPGRIFQRNTFGTSLFKLEHGDDADHIGLGAPDGFIIAEHYPGCNHSWSNGNNGNDACNAFNLPADWRIESVEFYQAIKKGMGGSNPGGHFDAGSYGARISSKDNNNISRSIQWNNSCSGAYSGQPVIYAISFILSFPDDGVMESGVNDPSALLSYKLPQNYEWWNGDKKIVAPKVNGVITTTEVTQVLNSEHIILARKMSREKSNDSIQTKTDTSTRIEQATSASQLFIKRSLLNLENKKPLDIQTFPLSLNPSGETITQQECCDAFGKITLRIFNTGAKPTFNTMVDVEIFCGTNMIYNSSTFVAVKESSSISVLMPITCLATACDGPKRMKVILTDPIIGTKTFNWNCN